MHSDPRDWCGHSGGRQSLASLGYTPGPGFVPVAAADLRQPLGSRITQIAARQPASPAVRSHAGTLTYRELIRRADAAMLDDLLSELE